MAWTDPDGFIPSVGDPFTAAEYKTYVKDNLKALAAGNELDRVKLTSEVDVTATTEATATTIIAGTSRVYGTGAVKVEFFIPELIFFPELTGTFIVKRGATVLGQLGVLHIPTGSGTGFSSFSGVFDDDAPPGGTYAYSVAAFTSTGTFKVVGGAGGSGTPVPGILRVTRRSSTL